MILLAPLCFLPCKCSSLQWLMRILFAASIGFQVPFKDFGNKTVILQGLIFTLALTGKLAVGFLVPNFNRTPCFTGLHLRDCLVTGFSMVCSSLFSILCHIVALGVSLLVLFTLIFASLFVCFCLPTLGLKIHRPLKENLHLSLQFML